MPELNGIELLVLLHEYNTNEATAANKSSKILDFFMSVAFVIVSSDY